MVMSMESEAHETAKRLIKLLKTTFKPENVEVEILYDKFPKPAYRVWGRICEGLFNLAIGSDTISLHLGLNWTKQAEFAYAHQWIGAQTLRRKPAYRKISKFWQMVERLKTIGYEDGGYDENPYSFVMSMSHPTPVRFETPESRERLITIIRETIIIQKEENPWAITEF